MESPTQAKARLRCELEKVDRSRSLEDRSAAAVALGKQLRVAPEWVRSRGVLAFHPLIREPDLRNALQQAIELGKVLALPRFSAQKGSYEAAEVRDLERELVLGQFGVMEPRSECPRAVINRLDLALIPGVGFDFAGGRLGRGGGYYDRLMAGFVGIKCGVAFEWQIVTAVPMEFHDVSMDCLLTPTGWRHLERGGAVGLE